MTGATLPGVGRLCETLEWDSAFFGCRIARYVGGTLGVADVEGIRGFCAAHAIDCLYLPIDACHPRSAGWAAALGARLVGTRVALAAVLPQALPQPLPDVVFRAACADDVPRLRAIAGESHRGTRFYADPGFDTSRCDALYRTWIEKSCRGAADAVFVAEHADDPVGYVTCHRESTDTGRIGLIAVAAAARSRGIGTRLVATALHWFHSERAHVVQVSTYADAQSALRLYERNGFVTRSVQQWFHVWRPRA